MENNDSINNKCLHIPKIIFEKDWSFNVKKNYSFFYCKENIKAKSKISTLKNWGEEIIKSEHWTTGTGCWLMGWEWN